MPTIAEIGGNHLNDLSRAKEMIACAADCGADIVKFQLFKPEQFPNNIATPEFWIPFLQAECAKRGVGFLTSVFYQPDFHLSAVKFAYSQRHNFELINWFEKSGSRIMVSGDRGTWWPKNCIKLVCVPKYPAKPDEYVSAGLEKGCKIYDAGGNEVRREGGGLFSKEEADNYWAFNDRRGSQDLIVSMGSFYDGISDHTIGIYFACRIKPKWIEKHFKLGDEGEKSPDAGSFAITPSELKEMVKCLKE